MKLATFRVETPVGPFDRFGVVLLDGGPGDTIEDARQNKGSVVDVNFAHAAMETDGGGANTSERANTFCPPDLQRFAELYGTDWSLATEYISSCKRKLWIYIGYKEAIKESTIGIYLLFHGYVDPGRSW